MTLTDTDIEVGSVWRSIRTQHNGKLVRVCSLSGNSVAVKVIAGGNSGQKMVGRREHIGRSQFLAHYELYKPAENRTTGQKTELPPSIPLSSLVQEQTNGTVEVAEQQHFVSLSDRAKELIERQYNKLTDEQKKEIAQLASDGVPTREIQKAYAVLAAVVGRIKREHNIPTPIPPSRLNRSRKKVAETVEPETDLDNIAQILRDAPPVPVVEKPTPPPVPTFVPKEVTVQPSSKNGVAPTTNFRVTILKMVPVEADLIIAAENMGDAYLKARQQEGVLDVLTVDKVR